MKPKRSPIKKRTGVIVTRKQRAARNAVRLDLLPIAPLIDRIVSQLNPEEIWLFGSQTEGRARPDSDYDLLAVLPDDATESDLDLAKAWELTRGLNFAADLVPCTRSEFEEEKDSVSTLASAAFHRGMRVYERRT